MKRISWSKVKRIVRKYPYYFDDAYKMSEAEAKKRMKTANILSFEEMVASAKLKYDFPPSAWEPFDAVIKRRSKKIWKFGSIKVAHPKLILVSASLIIAIFFFTVIPTGQVLAKSFFDMVAKVFNEYIIIYDQSEGMPKSSTIGSAPPRESLPETELSEPDTTETIYFNSIQEFVDQTGKKPVVFMDDYVIDEISYYPDEGRSGLILTTYYNYGEICVKQIWEVNPDTTIAINPDSYFSKTILDDKEAHCTITDDDIFNVVVVLDDSLLMIGIQNKSSAYKTLEGLAYAS